ncbi:putative polyribitolphosphotransferase [Lachnospiraceae bacterium KM106-2]|nr:putative polyribitolphosphotransferase [Lachnospiraceae bacterium KM106-2]
MESEIQLLQYKEGQGKLIIRLKGLITGVDSYDKIRVLLRFISGDSDRRIPLPVEYQYDSNQQEITFDGEMTIDLPNVFYHPKRIQHVELEPVIQLGMEEITDLTIKNQTNTELMMNQRKIVMQPSEFENHSFRNMGLPYRIYQVFAIPVSILLLPLWFLDGLRCVLGFGTVLPAESTSRGIKAIVKHGNARVKMISGFTFSPRENKTKLFCYYYKMACRHVVDEKQILFLSERAETAHGNAECVKAELEKNSDFSIVTYRNTKTVDQLELSELKKIAELVATSKLVILDDFYPQIHWLKLRKETELIQLWHACGAFKTFGFSRLGKKGGPRQSSYNHRSYDYAFVSGTGIRSIYSEGFAIPENHVLPLGVPRTDHLLDESFKKDTVEGLYSRYPALKNKKVVLIAPTFRGDGNRTAYYPVEQLDLNELCKAVSKDYIFVIKNHPFVKDKFVYDDQYNDQVMELSNEDINDLLLITDTLITDYSSVVFEAALLEIRTVFYVFDLEEYMKDRDIYYDFEHFAPGEITKNMDELKLALVNDEKNLEKIKQFREYFMDAVDGNATNRICDFIQKLMNA